MSPLPYRRIQRAIVLSLTTLFALTKIGIADFTALALPPDSQITFI